ncbi:MAG: hypothetical protein ACYDG4_17330 [Desulfuromonadaceae bacterium]
MKVGITGTRDGATGYQESQMRQILSKLWHDGAEFHHGDCVGVDALGAQIARSLGYVIVCHPPERDYLRAYEVSDHFREPKDYHTRDRNIVDETDLLIVVPKQMVPQNKGGTWYTHGYAVKKKKPLKMILPAAHDPEI